MLDDERLLLPQDEAPSIVVFVDEVFLANRSGFIQAAVPYLQEHYLDHVVPAVSTLPKRSAEYKAESISTRNQELYLDFLRTAVPASVALHKRFGVSVVVTAGSLKPYSIEDDGLREASDALKKGIQGALGLQDPYADRVIEEATKALNWIVNHGKAIVPQAPAGGVTFIFDEKYSHASTMNKLRLFHGPRFGLVLGRLQEAINTAAQVALNSRGKELTPFRINELRFVKSRQMRGLQVADVIAGMMWSKLRAAVGDTTPKHILRSAIFDRFCPDRPFSEVFLKGLSMVQAADGQKLLQLDAGKTGCRWRFGAPPELVEEAD